MIARGTGALRNPILERARRADPHVGSGLLILWQLVHNHLFDDLIDDGVNIVRVPREAQTERSVGFAVRLADDRPNGLNLPQLFDDKVAASEDCRSDGIKDGDAWRNGPRGYFISNCPEMSPTLDYSDGVGRATFTTDMSVREVSTCRWVT